MDREQVLRDKLCAEDGRCARGFRCQGGTCVLATTREQGLSLVVATAPDAAANPDESL
jgi:hypothetical protein